MNTTPIIPDMLQRTIVAMLSGVTTGRFSASLTIHTHGTYDRTMTVWVDDMATELLSVDGRWSFVNDAYHGVMAIDDAAQWVDSYANRAWVSVAGCPTCD
jgi:hypothetical protein